MAHPARSPEDSRRTAFLISTTSLLAWLRPWWESNRVAILQALVVFVSARVILGLIAVLATAYLPEQQGLHYTFHASKNVWFDVWARWDSEWYIDIAKQGYLARSELLAFFPLYPVLVSTFAPLFGYDYVISGIVVSSLAYFVALVYLFKLAAWEFGNEIASRTVLYIAVYPMALFFFAVYTESVFLAVTVAAFYYARRGEWGAAALPAFLAGTTRANGWLLIFPLAYEAWRQAGGNLRQAWLGFPSRVWDGFPRPSFSQILAVAAAPLGLLLWVLYLSWLFHDPLAYIHRVDQVPWLRTASLPWNSLLTSMQYLGRRDLSPLSRAANSTDLVVAVLLIEASVAAWWRLPRAYALYLTASTWMLLSSTVADWPLQSLPRYSLVLFPLFLLLAQLGANRNWDRVILMTSASLLGMYTALFATWYWVF